MAGISTAGDRRVEFVVARGKQVLQRCIVRVVDGSLVASAGSASGDDEPRGDVTLTLTPPDAALVAAGGLDPSVAFMRGQMKMEGDFALLMSFLPLARGPGFDAVRECLSAQSPDR